MDEGKEGKTSNGGKGRHSSQQDLLDALEEAAAPFEYITRKRKSPTAAAATLLLSAEETAMDGAPQGAVYQVEVKTREEMKAIGPSATPLQDLAFILENLEAEDWANQYEAIDALRRLAVHNRDLLHPHLGTLIPFVTISVQNLRSSKARNALLCLKELFTAPSITQLIPPEPLQSLCSTLVHRIAQGDKKFIVRGCGDALTAAIQSGHDAISHLLPALVPLVDSRNADVSSASLVWIEKCLEESNGHSNGTTNTTMKKSSPHNKIRSPSSQGGRLMNGSSSSSHPRPPRPPLLPPPPPSSSSSSCSSTPSIGDYSNSNGGSNNGPPCHVETFNPASSNHISPPLPRRHSSPSTASTTEAPLSLHTTPPCSSSAASQAAIHQSLGVELSMFLETLGRGYECRLAIGKNASRRSFRRIRSMMGAGPFKEALDETALAPALIQDILTHISAPSPIASNGSSTSEGELRKGRGASHTLGGNGIGGVRQHISAMRSAAMQALATPSTIDIDSNGISIEILTPRKGGTRTDSGSSSVIGMETDDDSGAR